MKRERRRDPDGAAGRASTDSSPPENRSPIRVPDEYRRALWPMKIVRQEELDGEPVSHNPRIRKQVFLRRGEIPRLTGLARAVFPPGEAAESHVHRDMSEVFLVVSGTGRLRGEREDTDLAPGHCVAVRPGEPHEFVNTGEENLVLVYFGIED
jgi:mannose-6-phosphate isomerase-like protein (cupin superfamily)